MHYQVLSVALMAVTGVMSSPSERANSRRNKDGDFAQVHGLIELENEQVEGGNVTYWGGAHQQDERDQLTPTGTIKLADRAECVPKPIISCDPDNYQARKGDCDNLAYNLQADGDRKLGKEIQEVCYSGDEGTCCIAWSKGIGNLKKGNLYHMADDIANTCTEGRVSGLFRGVDPDNLGDSLGDGSKDCVNVCVSNADMCGD